MTETSPMQRPFTSMSALIRGHAASQPAHAALVHGEQSMSYGELDAVMTRIGAALQRDGVQPGGTIAICATSSIEYAAVYLGAVRAGVVVAPLAPSSTAQSLAGMAADAGAQILFVDADVAAALQPVLPQLGATRLVTLDAAPPGKRSRHGWLRPARRS